MNMESEHLAEHPLMARLFADIQPLAKAGLDRIRESIRKEGGPRVKGSAQLREREHYALTSFRRISILTTAFDVLEMIEQFIRWLPPQKRFRELRISQERWLDYHYSYFLVIMSGLVDLSGLAINEILRLGIPEKSCRYQDIEANYWTRRYKISEPFRKLYTDTQKHRERRNSFVHHGEKPDISEVIESKDYETLTFVALANVISRQPLGGAKLFNEAFRAEIERLVDVMGHERSAARKVVETLFTALQPVYEAQLDRLTQD